MVDDGPGGVGGAVPEVVVFRVLGVEVAGFEAEVGDGAVLGRGEWSGWGGFLVFFDGLGEEGGEVVRVGGVDGLEGEAAGLGELADVAGGELGGFFRGVFDEGDGEAMAVGDEGDVEGGLLAELVEGGVVSVGDDGVCFGEPVGGEGAGGLDEGEEFGGELGEGGLEVREGVGGEFEAIF